MAALAATLERNSRRPMPSALVVPGQFSLGNPHTAVSRVSVFTIKVI
jgi:hypothetical protein